MKRKFVLVIIFLTIICVSILKLNNNLVGNNNSQIQLALTLDGEDIMEIPIKGNYYVKVKCKYGTGKWLYDEWKFVATNVESKVECYLDFETIQPNLNTYINSLVETTQGTGKVVSENGNRYEGKNPNNWILFNNEMWRIIGTFDMTLSDGTTVNNLTKIIRSDSLGTISWNKSSTNNTWSSASLNSLLNNYYYNATDGSSSGNCYIYSSTDGNCDYTYNGIKTKYRSMIENVKWRVGAIDDGNVTVNLNSNYAASDAYTKEAISTLSNYVGILSVSDYAYSVLSSYCSRTVALGYYDNYGCGSGSWLLLGLYEWTINKSSYSNYGGNYGVFTITPGGAITARYDVISTYFANDPTEAFEYRPVVYLKNNIKLVTGDGSYNNPYQIALTT